MSARLGVDVRAWGAQLGQFRCFVHLAWFFDLVFDSVMFLSHRLDPIHEHCS